MTSAEVAKQIGVPYRTLLGWVERAVLVPPDYVGKKWASVQWPDSLVREAGVIASLRKAGLSFQRIREAIGYLRSKGFNPFSSGRFVIVNVRHGRAEGLLRIAEDSAQAVELLGEGQGQLAFRLWEPEDGEVASD